MLDGEAEALSRKAIELALALDGNPLALSSASIASSHRGGGFNAAGQVGSQFRFVALRIERWLTTFRWQARFMAEGVDGLLHEATRLAGKPPLTPEVIERVVEMTLAEPPGERTHWTAGQWRRPPGSASAACSASGRRTGLKPHRVRTFKLSNDPKFAAKGRMSSASTSIHRSTR